MCYLPVVLLLTVVLLCQSGAGYTRESNSTTDASIKSSRKIFDCVSEIINRNIYWTPSQCEDCVNKVSKFCDSLEGRHTRHCKDVLAYLARVDCSFTINIMAGPKRNREDDDSDTTASHCKADELYGEVPGSDADPRCFDASPSKWGKLDKAPVRKYDGNVTDGALEIHTLPIGQGDCTIIYCPNKDYAILFDCGSSDSQGNTLTPDGIRRYYRHVKNMTIIISHGHTDHYKFIPALFSNSRYLSMINEVIVGGKESDYSNNLIKNWLQNVTKVHYLSNSFTMNDNYNFCYDERFKFEIIVGNSSRSSTLKNERGIVMKLSCPSCLDSGGRNVSVLFPGDMVGETAQKLASNFSLNSMYYKMAHHGSSVKANKNEWLNAISPVEVHISHAYRSRYYHPHCEAMDELVSLNTLGTEMLKQKHELPCTINRNKNLIVKNVFHRVYSTAPRENEICYIVLSITPEETTTTIFCGPPNSGPPSEDNGDDNEED